jgi:sugar lactone lactonase YvrE
MAYRLTRRIAGRGPEPRGFLESLRAVATFGSQGKDNAETRLYLAGDSTVAAFHPRGEPLARWATSRPGHAIAVARDGSVYVGQKGRLEIFAPDGALIDTWNQEEVLGLVTAIGFVGTDVLCADAADRCIRRFDADGRWLNNIGHDSRRRGFIIPNGTLDFAVDSAGILHVVNPGMHRIQRYTPEGELLGHFGRFDGIDPEGFRGCCNPTNIALTRDGDIVVSEKAEPRVKIYSGDGKLLTVVATQEFDLGCKNMDLATDAQGRIYVIDTVALDVCVFEESENG